MGIEKVNHMIFKRLFVFVVSASFLMNPLGEVQAETNRQVRLQRMEINAALQRLELNKKTTTTTDLWRKARENYSPSMVKNASLLMRLDQTRKAPQISVTEFQKDNGSGFRFLLQDQGSSVNMEIFEGSDGQQSIRLGKSIFKPEELENLDAAIKKYNRENRAEVDRALYKEIAKKGRITLTAKELSRLTPQQRALYYINIRYLVAAAAEVELAFAANKETSLNESEKSASFFVWLDLLNETAHANNARAEYCVVAGWPASFTTAPARNGVTCPFPQAGTEAERQHCGSNQAPCNPSIFGNDNGKPHCVPFTYGRASEQSNRATLACHQKPPVLDGSVEKTVALIKSMQSSNDALFNGNQIADGKRDEAIAELQKIIAATENSIGKCLAVRDRTTGEVTVQGRTEVAANAYVSGGEEEFRNDRSDARQIATCRVLMSRKKALEDTLHTWSTGGGSSGGTGGTGCTVTPGVVTIDQLPATPQQGCVPQTVASGEIDWTPLYVLGGLLIVGIGACLIFKIGPCKKKKSTPINPPPEIPKTPEEPPQPPNPPQPPDPPNPPDPAPIEGGTREPAPDAGGIRPGSPNPGTIRTTR